MVIREACGPALPSPAEPLTSPPAGIVLPQFPGQSGGGSLGPPPWGLTWKLELRHCLPDSSSFIWEHAVALERQCLSFAFPVWSVGIYLHINDTRDVWSPLQAREVTQGDRLLFWMLPHNMHNSSLVFIKLKFFHPKGSSQEPSSGKGNFLGPLYRVLPVLVRATKVTYFILEEWR